MSQIKSGPALREMPGVAVKTARIFVKRDASNKIDAHLNSDNNEAWST